MENIKSYFAYGQMAFILAFIGLPTYIFAPEFYARHYKLSLVDLAGVLLALRLVDALRICILVEY